MDATDALILIELCKDSQMPFSRISKKLGISTDTVCKRYKKMKKNNSVIVKNSLAINPEKLNFQAMISLLLKIVADQKRAEVENCLKKIPQITVIVEITGDFNLYCDAIIKNLRDFTELIREIGQIAAIERIDFMLSEDFTLFRTSDYNIGKYLENSLK
ncbi:MAG: Lrp/AsnC family transcriptional regulator [Candidatus Bathyarchaeia archaeon]|jgi:DNA-binding Lrp family transcriptional regulator